MYGNGDEVQLPMDFQIADVNELSAPRFRKLFDEVENNSAHGQPEYFFSNHDQPRQWDRYGDGEHNDQIAKLMAVLELTTRGTPQMYYGEETRHAHHRSGAHRGRARSDRQARLAEGEGPRRRAHADAVGRGAAECGVHAPTAKPWLPIPPSAETYNVEIESKDPNSIFNFYKQLLALRQTNPALKSGGWVTINPDDPNVFTFLRHDRGMGARCWWR